jgi:hypothetical protein
LLTAQRARLKLFVAVIVRFAFGVKLPLASNATRLWWRSSFAAPARQAQHDHPGARRAERDAARCE